MSDKTCFKCGATKDLSEFYRHPKMADGHLNKCKTCAREDVHANREAKIDYYRAYDCTRAKNPKRKQNAARVSRRWLREDSRRSRAHNMVRRAVLAGRLEPKPCETCNTTLHVHAHHDDYNKPLEVRWLCAAHHKHTHKET